MFTKPGYAPVLPGLVVLDLQGCHGGPNGERGIYPPDKSLFHVCDLGRAKLNIVVLTGLFGSPGTFCWGNK